MQRLDIFALPSLTEGTPNTIVEAMSHGVPTIASAVGGIPDLINAETGILCPAGDVAALAEAITRLAKDKELRLKMGQAARTRYEQLFSPQAVLPILLDTYNRVAARNDRDSQPHLQNTPFHPWTQSLLAQSRTEPA
jgi:glycosyltransferase involved in cell wall biosynthesis